MNIVSATEARKNLYNLMDEAAAGHEPVIITGRRNNSVLVSQEDWDSIQETIYLLSIPGLPESIKEGRNTPLDECATELDW